MVCQNLSPTESPVVSQYERKWTGQNWQSYALRLVQLRHGATNVQRVPDKVKGDGGLEFFTLDGCLIQCYAPEETVDVGKSSSAMKQKATQDIPKVAKNKSIIECFLQNTKARRWILLCPFLDDKQVVAHVRAKGNELLSHSLPFLADDFQALVHSQEDFATEIEALKRQAIGPPIFVDPPTPSDIAAADTPSFTAKLDDKLPRAFPGLGTSQIATRRHQFLFSYVKRKNALDNLRLNPTLYEQAFNTIASEESRLEMLGTTGNVPRDMLQQSLDRIEAGLKRDVPSLTSALHSDLAQGTLSDWLIRCPLDFY